MRHVANSSIGQVQAQVSEWMALTQEGELVSSSSQNFESWLRPDENGLLCAPGGFYIDPHVPVGRAVITHGHSDHARAGHSEVLATQQTLDALMKLDLSAGVDVEIRS